MLRRMPPAAPQHPSPGGLDLDSATVAQAGAALAEGRTTSVELTRAYLARIDAVDRSGPGISAMRCLHPDAVAQAAASDERRREGRRPGALEGVPVVVKDNIDVAGLPTTAGALALEHSVPSLDAPVVARLREAGAVVLGKANLTELANYMTEHMPSGYSSLGGQVLNPYDTTVTPSGSSSGSGAVVALGLATLAVGTETHGSIASPAAYQSVVGVKPTVGLVSRTGIVPIASSHDTAGPMTRTVADAALLLGVLAGADAEDPASLGARDGGRHGLDYVAGLDAEALRGARLAAVRPPSDLEPGQPECYADALEALRAAGAVVIEDIAPPPAVGYPLLEVLRYEFGRDLDRYLARLPADAPVRSVAALQGWNRDHADAALKFGQVHVDAAVEVDHERDRAAYEAILTGMLALARERGVDAALRQHGAEALVFPHDHGYTCAASAGYPSIAVPAGYTAGARRPFGLMLVGPAWGEARLLALAYAYEQATQLRCPPAEVNPAPYRGTLLARPAP